MKNLLRALPIVAVIAVLGGAIYYVQSSAPQRLEPAQVTKPSAAAKNMLPPSDRYANDSARN